MSCCDFEKTCKNAGGWECHNCTRSYDYEESGDNFEEIHDEEEAKA